MVPFRDIFSIIEQEAYKSVHFPDVTVGVFRADIISAKQRKGGCSTQTRLTSTQRHDVHLIVTLWQVVATFFPLCEVQPYRVSWLASFQRICAKEVKGRRWGKTAPPGHHGSRKEGPCIGWSADRTLNDLSSKREAFLKQIFWQIEEI